MSEFNPSRVGKSSHAEGHSTTEHKHQHRANKLEKFIYSVITVATVILSVLAILFVFVFKIMIFTGGSMNPTLNDGDKILVNILDTKPSNGDIAVIVGSKGDNRAVKRVIATEGQTVDIDYDTNTVYVNNKALDEQYLLEEDMYTAGDINFPATVPAGCCFVMGDNRNISLDSRFSALGFVKQEDIIGTVLLKYNKEGVTVLEDTPVDTDFEEVLNGIVDGIFSLFY